MNAEKRHDLGVALSDLLYKMTNGMYADWTNPDNVDAVLKVIDTFVVVAPVERPRMFPMQWGPKLTWNQAEHWYEAYSALYGTNQSIERMAQRGGFSWQELGVIERELQKRRPGFWTDWRQRGQLL